MESFQVLRRIGTGTYGSAFLVCLKEDESRRFVLKKINMSQMSERERAAAHQEVRLLAQLDHPFVLGYHDSFQHRGHMCIVTEYCEAGDLYRLLKRQNEPLPEEQIKEWLAQVTLALHYIHERKVVHRDLKSQNIFLTRDGSAKLGDFGIARVLSSPQELARTVIGTPYYMSPEIVRNQPYSYQSDVWSLGCVVFEMATGKHAFDAADMNALVMKILRGKVDRLGPQYSPDLQQLLDLMLARDPARRPTTEQILHCPFLREHVVEAKHEAAVWRAGRGKKGGTPARDTPPPPPASAGARAPVLRQRSQSMHDHAAASSAHGEPRTSGKLPAKQHTPAGSASHHGHHHRHHHHHHHHSHHHSQSYHDPAHRRSRSDVRTSEPAASLAPAPPLPPGPQQRHLRADPRLAGVRSRSVAQIQVTREADAAPEWLRREGPPAQGGGAGHAQLERAFSERGGAREGGGRSSASEISLLEHRNRRRERLAALKAGNVGGGSEPLPPPLPGSRHASSLHDVRGSVEIGALQHVRDAEEVPVGFGVRRAPRAQKMASRSQRGLNPATRDGSPGAGPSSHARDRARVLRSHGPGGGFQSARTTGELPPDEYGSSPDVPPRRPPAAGPDGPAHGRRAGAARPARDGDDARRSFGAQDMAALLGPAAAPSSRAPLQRAAASSSALDPHVGAQAASYPPRPPPASGGSPLRHTGGRGARSAAAPSRDPSPPPRRSSNIVADSAAYFELSESDSEAEARAVAAVQGRPGGNSRVSTGPVAPAGSVGGNTGSTADATDRLRALELKESLLSQAIEELEQEAHSVTEPLEAIEEEDPALLSGRGLNTTVDPKSAPCLTDQAQLLRQAVTEAIGDDGFRRLYGSVRDAVSGRVPGDTQAFAQQLPPQQRPLLALVDKLVYIEDVMSGRAA